MCPGLQPLLERTVTGQSGVTINPGDANSKMPGNHFFLCSALSHSAWQLCQTSQIFKSESPQLLFTPLAKNHLFYWKYGQCWMGTPRFLLPTPQMESHFIHPSRLPSSHLERRVLDEMTSVSFLFSVLSLQLLPLMVLLAQQIFLSS